MPLKLACILSLIVFSACLVAGAFSADNTFVTTVTRALLAMFGTMVIAWVVGAMAQRMLEERIQQNDANGK